METTPPKTGWKPSLRRRALIAVALAGAVFIPSCSEDPVRQSGATPPRGELEQPSLPSAPAPPSRVDPYLGYSR